METSETEAVFQAVSLVLHENQALFNAIDEINHNHGDHMVEIFDTALLAAREHPHAGLPEQLGHAGRKLLQLSENGSACVYADGLLCLSEKLLQQQISQNEIFDFVKQALSDEKTKTDAQKNPRAGEVLKALLHGLADWNQAEARRGSSGGKMSMGDLFELGIAYMQAKQRGGSRIEILADAAVSASPLKTTPHRSRSGKLVFQAILQALADICTGAEQV